MAPARKTPAAVLCGVRRTCPPLPAAEPVPQNCAPPNVLLRLHPPEPRSQRVKGRDSGVPPPPKGRSLVVGYGARSQQVAWAIREPVTRSRTLGPARAPWAGVPSAAAPNHTSPSPIPTASGRRFRTRAFLQWGAVHSPAEKRGAALRGGRWRVRETGLPGGPEAKESAARCRRSRGAGPERGAESQVNLGCWLCGSRQAGPEGTAGRGARRPRQVRSPADPTLQLPRTLTRPAPPDGQRPPPQLHGTGARARDRKASQPLRAGARAEGGCVRPWGHLAGRGKPSEGPSVRSGEGEAKCGQEACAV